MWNEPDPDRTQETEIDHSDDTRPMEAPWGFRPNWAVVLALVLIVVCIVLIIYEGILIATNQPFPFHFRQ